MGGKLLATLEKAKAPWWVWLLVLLATIAVGLLKLRSSAAGAGKRVTNYLLNQEAKKAQAATTAEEATAHWEKAKALKNRSDEIDANITAIQVRADAARDRIRAATSFSDLQP